MCLLGQPGCPAQLKKIFVLSAFKPMATKPPRNRARHRVTAVHVHNNELSFLNVNVSDISSTKITMSIKQTTLNVNSFIFSSSLVAMSYLYHQAKAISLICVCVVTWYVFCLLLADEGLLPNRSVPCNHIS